MLKCYLLTVCRGSVLDKYTNNFSIFNLVEEIHIPREALGQIAPFEVHFHWLVGEGGHQREYEIRLVRVAEDGSKDFGAPIRIAVAEAQRQRIKVDAIRLPRSFGKYLLRAEWRVVGSEEWTLDDVIWPLTLAEAKEAPARPEGGEAKGGEAKGGEAKGGEAKAP